MINTAQNKLSFWMFWAMERNGFSNCLSKTTRVHVQKCSIKSAFVYKHRSANLNADIKWLTQKNVCALIDLYCTAKILEKLKIVDSKQDIALLEQKIVSEDIKIF